MSTIDMNDLVAKRNEKKTDELNKLTENIRETASEIVGEVHDILESIDKPGLSHDEKIAARKDALKRLREIRAGRPADRTNPGESPTAASPAQPKPKGPKSDAPKAKPAPAPKQEPVAAKEESSQPVIVPTATKEPAPEPEKSGKDKFFNFFQGVSPGGAHK